MKDCWSFTCCLSWTLDSLMKCGQLKSFSIGITLVDVHLNWLNWFHFLFSRERSTCYSDRLHDFSFTIPRCFKDVIEWNKLDLDICKSKSYATFRNTMLKLSRPNQRAIYSINNHVGLKLLYATFRILC